MRRQRQSQTASRYPRQPDPRPGVPLAWRFESGGQRVGDTPRQQLGLYRKIIIGQEVWFVHCSFAGALELLFEALGEGNVDVQKDEENEGYGITSIKVPDNLVGSWIGQSGCVAGFIKNMLGIERVNVIGEADWRRR